MITNPDPVYDDLVAGQAKGSESKRLAVTAPLTLVFPELWTFSRSAGNVTFGLTRPSRRTAASAPGAHDRPRGIVGPEDGPVGEPGGSSGGARRRTGTTRQ